MSAERAGFFVTLDAGEGREKVRVERGTAGGEKVENIRGKARKSSPCLAKRETGFPTKIPW